MKEYIYTKTLGIIVGTLTIFVAIGFGILSLIGMGLSKAFNTGNEYSASNILVMVSLLLLCGLITGIGAFRLKSRAWKIFYIGFCLILGVVFIVAFFISFGSIGLKNEIFILCIGIIYLLLGYLAKREK